jgi:DnaJ-class molecular chaperone
MAQGGCAAAAGRLRYSKLGKKDYYQVLGVKETASARAIERAYWNMARAYHKKSGRSKSAKRRLLTLNEAYENLASPARRKAYDRQRRQHQEPKAPRGLWGLLWRLRPWNGRFRNPLP